MNDTTRDVLLARIDENVQAIRSTQGDHETRIRSLVITKQRQLGALSLISASIAGAWALLVALWAR